MNFQPAITPWASRARVVISRPFGEKWWITLIPCEAATLPNAVPIKRPIAIDVPIQGATSCIRPSRGNLMPRYLRRLTSTSQSVFRWISTQANKSSFGSVAFCKNSDSSAISRCRALRRGRSRSCGDIFVHENQLASSRIRNAVAPRLRRENLCGLIKPAIARECSPVALSMTMPAP